MIDSKQQLTGKAVDEEVMSTLQQSGYMTIQHLTLIDIILPLPGSIIEEELQRRIAAINALTAFCSVEDGATVAT